MLGFWLIISGFQEMIVAQMQEWLGDEELWLESRYILELEPTGVGDRLWYQVDHGMPGIGFRVLTWPSE